MSDSTRPEANADEGIGARLDQSNALKLLLSGRFSDFTITCGDHEFKVHRSILSARSSYFHTLVAGNFKEAQAQQATFSEDDPSFLARVLIYLYSGSYPETPVSELDRIVNQFSDLEETYCGPSMCNVRSLHASIFALGVKFCDESLKRYATDQFIRAWYPKEKQEDDGFQQICCEKATCEDENAIFRTQHIVYESTPVNESALREVVVFSTQCEIGQQRLIQDHRFQDALSGLPEFCFDLLRHPFTGLFVTCSDCGDEMDAISELCDCSNWAHQCEEGCFAEILAKRRCRMWSCKGKLRLEKEGQSFRI